MTSVKYYSKWIKEAGRGHITAFLSWGVCILYTVFTMLEIRMDMEYVCFGIGNESLFKICIALGILTAVSEFWYLYQPSKLDFYYSLPVKKGTIFWCRYVHGAIHVVLPVTLGIAVLSVYGGIADQRFLPYAGGYAVRSVLAFLAVFFLFYHITAAVFLAGGRIAAAVLLEVIIFVSGIMAVHGIGEVYAQHFFETYYRIPAFEKIAELLSPAELSGKLTGMSVFESQEIYEYVPENRVVLAVVLWIVVFGGLAAYMQKKRKPENVGKLFAFYGVGRMAVFWAAVMLPLVSGSFLLELTEIQDNGLGCMAAVLGVCEVLLLILVHMLAERLVYGRKKMLRTVRGKWQMFAEGLIVCLVAGCFIGGVASFDRFLPERENLEAISICVNGLHMSQREYTENFSTDDSYGIDRELSQYKYTEDGLEEGFSWVSTLVGRKNEGTLSGGKGSRKYPAGYTFAAVCFQMKDGTEKYRVYPVDKESFEDFSAVFETKEHKEKAYPVLTWADVSENRFTWKDGVDEQVLKLSGEEKKTLFGLYKEDVLGFQMEKLGIAPPYGTVEIKSDKWGETEELYVYPFFEKTCRFLKEHGIETGKEISDYLIRSLKVMNVQAADGNAAGGVTMDYCEEEEEIARWKGRLIWKELDLQPLLYPLDYGKEIEAEIEEPESGAVVEVECYGK